jgi:hypothetical protein
MPTQAYERGSQAIIFPMAATNSNQQQVGQAAPTGATVFALIPSVSRGQNPYQLAVQVRTSGTVTGLSVQLLGSLDGTNFFPIGAAITAAGISSLANFPVRFVCASIASFTGGGSVEVSFAA